jgi:2'-5' RNA ligase
MPLSAFIVRVPEAEPTVSELRRKFDATAALGVPAHITILYPFMEPDKVTPEVLRSVQEAVAKCHAFAFALRKGSRWPETTYLLPEPAQPFIRLTKAIVQRFPTYPPYSGRHSEIIPHLTVADGSEHAANAAEAELKFIFNRSGPINATCRQIELIENSSGVWRTMHVLALGASGA